MTKHKSVIFDFDGVIADSQHVHKKSLELVAREVGIDFDEESYIETLAGPLTECLKPYLNKGKPPADMPTLIGLYKSYFYNHLDDIKLVDGAETLINTLKKHAFPAAIASSSSYDYISYCVKKFGFGDYFHNKIASIEMVNKGKPEPDLFLLAAEKLGSDPADCIAIDDSPDGITAAARCGMAPILYLKQREIPAASPKCQLIYNLLGVLPIINLQ